MSAVLGGNLAHIHAFCRKDCSKEIPSWKKNSASELYYYRNYIIIVLCLHLLSRLDLKMRNESICDLCFMCLMRLLEAGPLGCVISFWRLCCRGWSLKRRGALLHYEECRRVGQTQLTAGRRQCEQQAITLSQTAPPAPSFLKWPKNRHENVISIALWFSTSQHGAAFVSEQNVPAF